MLVGDLYLSANGDITTRAQFGLLAVYYVFYGSRNLVLAVVSAQSRIESALHDVDLS